MNVILVGKNINELGVDAQAKASFSALIDVKDFNDEVVNFMKDKITIALCDTSIAEEMSPWEFKELCEKTNSKPFFVAEQVETPIEYTMCLQMNTWYPDSACYIINDDKEEYDVFINILTGVLAE